MTPRETSLTDNAVAVIPARFRSSRFPGKPLVRIRGVPLILRVHARVATAFPADQIVVATDDQRIRDVCEAHQVRTVMTSTTCLTGTDRVCEAASALDADIIVNVQGDEPLIHGDDILAVLQAKRAHPDQVINAMCALPRDIDATSPNIPKVVARRDGQLVYMSRAPIPFAHDRRAEPTFLRQVCIYAFSRRELELFASVRARTPLERAEDIEILRFVDLGVPVRMVTVRGASLAVDVPADVLRVEQELDREALALHVHA